MSFLKAMALTIWATLLTGPALAHQSGVPHAHDGAAMHPVFGIDHLLILLGLVVVGALIVWRSR